jgi:hypothetical protein
MYYWMHYEIAHCKQIRLFQKMQKKREMASNLATLRKATINDTLLCTLSALLCFCAHVAEQSALRIPELHTQGFTQPQIENIFKKYICPEHMHTFSCHCPIRNADGCDIYSITLCQVLEGSQS